MSSTVQPRKKHTHTTAAMVLATPQIEPASWTTRRFTSLVSGQDAKQAFERSEVHMRDLRAHLAELSRSVSADEACEAGRDALVELCDLERALADARMFCTDAGDAEAATLQQ